MYMYKRVCMYLWMGGGVVLGGGGVVGRVLVYVSEGGVCNSPWALTGIPSLT